MKKLLIGIGIFFFSAHANAQFLNKLKKATSSVKEATELIGKKQQSSPGEENTTNKTTKQGRKAATPKSEQKISGTRLVEEYGKEIASIPAKEYLVGGEQSLSMVNNHEEIRFITRNQDGFYLYKGSNKTGPFPKAPVNELAGYTSRKRDLNEITSKTTPTNGYISGGTLKVDGKIYGTGLTVHSFYHSPTSKQFYSIISKMTGNKRVYSLQSEHGKISLGESGGKLMVSENDGIAGVRLEDDANGEFSIILSDGRKIGPFKNLQEEFTFLDDAANLVQVKRMAPGAVYLNGNKVIDLPQGSQGRGLIISSTAADKAVWYENGSLLFSDGFWVSNMAMKPVKYVENDVEIISWITMFNNKIYVCKRPL